jgi:uncharacterized protein (UPF0262 family)
VINTVEGFLSKAFAASVAIAQIYSAELQMTDAPPDRTPLNAPLQDKTRNRLIAISLDDSSIRRTTPNIDHEREVAIFDILDGNSFAIEGRDEGPYKLMLGIAADRLVLTIGNATSDALVTHVLSLTPLKRVMKDYFIVCDSYYQAIRTLPPSRIQAIDMGRRGLHDEGSQLLSSRLEGKFSVDSNTSRRLFTLICALHWRG